MENFQYLEGVYNITPTPFTPDGALDKNSLRRLTDFIIKTGVNGMTILGVLGESHKVTEAEREQIIATVIEAVNGRIPVCVGTSHSGTDTCIVYSKQAEAMGAKAVMVAPPKLSRSTDAALRRHYLAVAEAVSIPVVIQDHPASSGVVMSIDFIAAIADEAPHCAFLKLEDEPSPTKVSAVLNANANIKVLGGLGGMMFLEELRHGAVGTMTGFAFPEILVDIYQKYHSGDIDGATEIFYRYCPLIRFENQPLINLALRKQIYHIRGAIDSPRVRSPFMPVDAGTLADLNDILTRLELTPEQV
ncbi:MAG TPA: dihydrodipicolinate synthase family protein [Aggregatilineales bacterium]|nr:dihydrodipicolinate synthase family protein [Aggregatilineales bacterium]